MSDPRGRRGLILVLLVVVGIAVVAWVGLGGTTPLAAPLASGDSRNGATITNDIDSATVTILYERPDGGTE